MMFNISLPQASLDLSKYLQLAPQNLTYDRNLKAYFPTANFAPAVIQPDADLYLSGLLRHEAGTPGGWSPPVESVPHPMRQVKSAILRPVLRAIRWREKLTLKYQSFSSPTPSERAISPHAIGHDGFRWHVRAFCHAHDEFRDFVFARILEVRTSEPTEADPLEDIAWHRHIDLILGPHPDLSEAQKRALALDYGMKKGRVILKTRQALAFYVMRQLGLNSTENGPRTQQIVLLNQRAVEPLLNRNA